jgi:predicted phage baseplate assembly protein
MTLPLENLDDKTFDDLVRDAISRIPVYAPSWTDYNKSDPGITFIELLAWIVETQIYRLNRISDRSYLKFFRLLGIEGPLPVRPARVDVTFSLQGASAALPLPAGTEVVATKSGIVFRTQRPLTVLDLELCKTIPDLPNFIAIDQSASKDEAFRLGFKCHTNVPLNGEILSLAIYLKDAPTRPDEDLTYTSDFLSWECLYADGTDKWTAMKKVNDETNDLFYTGKIELKFEVDPLCSKNPPSSAMSKAQSPDDMSHDDFLGFIWIRCKINHDSWETYDSPIRIESILANTVSALEGARFEEEIKSSGLPSMTVALQHTPVYEISLKSGETGWDLVKDLDSSGPKKSQFLLDSEKGIISFGDGINGAIPPKDCAIQIIYFSGAGENGNVPSHAIDSVVSIDSSRLKVENKRAAEGAVTAETMDKAKSRARRSLNEINRAITLSDYEALAYLTPGIRVARAKAIPCYHPVTGFGTANAVTVIAVPVSSNPQPFPSKMFLRAVFEHLDKHRLLTTRLFVYPPVYVKAKVKANVVARTRWDATKVHDAVCNRLRDFLSPMSGGLEGKGWPFGRAVYLSEIYKIIAATDGVDYVEVEKLEGIICANETGVKQNEMIVTDEAGNLRIPEYGLVYLDTENDRQIIVTPGEEQSIIRKEVSCE